VVLDEPPRAAVERVLVLLRRPERVGKPDVLAVGGLVVLVAGQAQERAVLDALA